MCSKHKSFFYTLLFLFFSCIAFAQPINYLPEDRVAADFQKLLDRPKVDFGSSFQITKIDSVIIETGFIYSEKDEKVPMLIYKPVSNTKSFPAVVFLHGTGGSKDNEGIKNMLYQLTRRGIMGVAIDARYHGTRIPGGAHGSTGYRGMAK